jgi:hypothetical protein
MDEPTQSQNECWRFPEDETLAIQSSLDFREIDPNETITETYNVYTRGNSLPCLPEGEFEFQDESYFGSETQPMILSLTIQVSSEKELSVDSELEFSDQT